MISKNNQYLKKWPAGIIEIVNVARIAERLKTPALKDAQVRESASLCHGQIRTFGHDIMK